VVLCTGLKAAQALKIRLEDLKIERGNAWILLPGREEIYPRSLLLPPSTIGAILTYLDLSGKVICFQPEDPLFTPLEDMTGILERKNSSNWDRRSLSREKAGQYLRQYAAWAELEPGRVTLESLRSTGALLRLREGASLRELADYLDLDQLHQAARFLRSILDQPAAKSWLKDSPVSSWLEEHGRYSRLNDFPASSELSGSLEDRVECVLRESVLPPPNQPSLSKRRPSCEPSLLTRNIWEVFSQPIAPKELAEARLVESLDDEIALMRVLTRRLFEAIPDDAPPLDAVKWLDNIGLMCSRIGRLYFIRHKTQGKPGPDLASFD
jgi:hypothetical protein